MKKKFYNLSLILIVATAILSVFFAIVHYIASEYIDSGSTLVAVTFYVKKAFDLVAVFTGYGTIIYAFSRYSTLDGARVTAYFAISVLISFTYQLFGTCIYEANFSLDFILYTIYYAFGDCFITQYIPALIIAYVAYKSTKNGTRRVEEFVSWRNPTQRVMMLVTLVIFAINLVTLLIFNVFAFLIESEWMIYLDELGAIFLSILETAFIYIVLQYIMYMVIHLIYTKYTDLGGSGCDGNSIKILSED